MAKAARPLILDAPYRNKFECAIAEQLDEAGVKFSYETLKLPVAYPPRIGKYTPDFISTNTNIIIEGKGFFHGGASDRQKLVLVKEQHPDIDLRIVFQNAAKPIYKGSKTTYGKWATDHNFAWADKGIVPASWIKELKNECRRTNAKRSASKAPGS
jgi:hypothetical protein